MSDKLIQEIRNAIIHDQTTCAGDYEEAVEYADRIINAAKEANSQNPQDQLRAGPLLETVKPPVQGAGTPDEQPSWMPLEHRMNCPALVGEYPEANNPDCTCGLYWRIQLQTEREMYNAWRKRAEEAEAAHQPPVEALRELRAQGWMVAVHNDYRQDGKLRTFWLFVKEGRAIKGEGDTDEEALAQARALAAQEKPAQPSEGGEK